MASLPHLYSGSFGILLSSAFLSLSACSAADGESTAGTGGAFATGGASSGGTLTSSGGALGTGGTEATGGALGTGGGAPVEDPGFCSSFANGSGTTQPCYVGEDKKAYCIADDGTTTALGSLPGDAVNVTGQNFTTAACAVNAAGAVYCGQYGVLGTTAAFVASGATQVSGSLNGQCAIVGTKIQCEGVDLAEPALPSGNPVEIACYYHGCCARTDEGKAFCWGDTTAIGGSGTAVREVTLPGGKKATGLGPGQDHICVLLEGGAVQCYGKDWNKQLGGLGENTTTGQSLAASGAVSVAAGQFHTCIAFEDGTVQCVSGGQSEGAGLDQGTLTAVTGINSAISVTAGKHYTCALLADRSIRCWGRIGGGTTPVLVTGPKVASCN